MMDLLMMRKQTFANKEEKRRTVDAIFVA